MTALSAFSKSKRSLAEFLALKKMVGEVCLSLGLFRMGASLKSIQKSGAKLRLKV
jgi:hypothetical protein